MTIQYRTWNRRTSPLSGKRQKAFDDTIQQNNLYGDVFGEDENDIKDTEYWKILNVADDGVMGYLSIPKINIKLAIYHGTGDDELQTGVGHLNGTKPGSEERVPTVFSQLTGLPSAKLYRYRSAQSWR